VFFKYRSLSRQWLEINCASLYMIIAIRWKWILHIDLLVLKCTNLSSRLNSARSGNWHLLNSWNAFEYVMRKQAHIRKLSPEITYWRDREAWSFFRYRLVLQHYIIMYVTDDNVTTWVSSYDIAKFIWSSRFIRISHIQFVASSYAFVFFTYLVFYKLEQHEI